MIVFVYASKVYLPTDCRPIRAMNVSTNQKPLTEGEFVIPVKLGEIQ